jgi:integrase
LLLAQDIHPKIVQERLGHSDIGMTLNRYSHVTPSMQREAAEALKKAIENANGLGEVVSEENDQNNAV